MFTCGPNAPFKVAVVLCAASLAPANTHTFSNDVSYCLSNPPTSARYMEFTEGNQEEVMQKRHLRKDPEEEEEFALGDDRAAVCGRESSNADVSSEEPGGIRVPGLEKPLGCS